jgi:hypothetical protein
MEPSTSLIASAQIAVAIAGFAGVVAMFRSESVHTWGDVERFWLRLLLLNSILPLSFSLVGLFFIIVGFDPSTTWRSCSGFAALLLLPYAFMIFRNLVRFTPEQLKAAGGGKLISYMLFSLLTVVSLLQLWNVAALSAFWPFFCAIVVLLMGAMYQFVRLVLAPKHPDAEEYSLESEEE